MKEIYLTNSKDVVLVDDEDYKMLIQYKWSFYKSKRSKMGRAQTNIKINNKRTTLLLHHLIIKKPSNKKEIDHIDRNPLNNQKNNLRIVTHSQNMMNKSNYKNSTSKFKGVYWDKSRKMWRSAISEKNKRINLGRFTNEIDAAKAYNEKAEELHGEYAYLNEV